MVSAIDPTKPADGVAAVKADLRANLLAAKREIEALQANKIGQGDPVDMQYKLLSRAVLKDVSETVATPPISAGALQLNLEFGNVFEVTLTESVVSLTLVLPQVAGLAGSCCLILKQDGSGGRTMAWPAWVRWPGGVKPAISAASNAVDFFAFVTVNGGATWYGFPCGIDFR